MAKRSKIPNQALRRIREEERNESRGEFCRAMEKVALELKVNAACDERTLARFEDGDTQWPGSVYRRILTTMLGRTTAELGFHKPGRLTDGIGASVADAEAAGFSPEDPSPLPSLLPLPRDADRREEDSESAVSGTEFPLTEWGREQTEQLADALADGSLVVGPENALRLAHVWLVVESPQVVEMRSGGKIGNGLLEKIENRIDELRKMDDFVGGGDLLQLVADELQKTLAVMREASYSESVGVRLLVAMAELGQLAGWVASDAGLHAAAERYYLLGAQAAHAAAHMPLWGNLVSSLSYQVSNVGDPRVAMTLAATAHKGASGATATTRALLLERLSWTYAKAGNWQLCERALGEAAEWFGKSEPTEDPTWTYWLNQTEMDIMAGRCYTELRRPLKAAPILEQALESYDESYSREVALYLTWLAEDYILANEIDAACKVAGRALVLARRVNSPRAHARIHVIHDRLTPYSPARAVREFRELYRDAQGN